MWDIDHENQILLYPNTIYKWDLRYEPMSKLCEYNIQAERNGVCNTKCPLELHN